KRPRSGRVLKVRRSHGGAELFRVARLWRWSRTLTCRLEAMLHCWTGPTEGDGTTSGLRPAILGPFHRTGSLYISKVHSSNRCALSRFGSILSASEPGTMARSYPPESHVAVRPVSERRTPMTAGRLAGLVVAWGIVFVPVSGLAQTALSGAIA